MAISSNLVRVTAIEETVYGQTPVAGNFDTVRFTSESLSGTPDTVQSQQIRTDRQSSGQIVTGLQVAGGVNFEFCKEAVLDKFMAAAMYSDWVTKPLVTVDLTIDPVLKTITRASGSFITEQMVKGDFISLAGFADSKNNVKVMITEVVSATVIKYLGPYSGLVAETGVGTSFKPADKLTIGTTKRSFTIEKKFTDLTNKGIIYRGMIPATMELNVAYGELINGSFSFSGNGYQAVSSASDFATDGRTINPAATAQTLNGSVDMPFIGTDALGDFSQDGLDIQSIGLSLDNGLTAQNVIGTAAPKDYTAGQASVEVNLSAYLSNESWGMLDKKLKQTPFALGFLVENIDGAYGFFMPAIQVSSDDPTSGGQNQDVILEMSGMGKVGPNQEKALSIYKFA